MQEKEYQTPELTELGHLQTLVKGGIPKTGPANDGNGIGEISKTEPGPQSNEFERSRSSSDESGGRGGRGGN